MTMPGHRAASLLLACLMWQLAPSGWAQNYPAKVVRYLVPTPAGSGADTIGRIIAGGLSQVSGQQVVVDNRAGGGNNIGAEIAAKATADGGAGSRRLGAWMRPGSGMQAPNVESRSYARLRGRIPMNGAPAPRFGAPPDGYTVFQATLTHAVNATLYRKLGYDLVRDFAPVTQLASSPYVLVVHPSLPVKSAAELVKLAVTTAQRLPALPSYPTVAEADYLGYLAGNWFGLMVPAKTPRETIATIRAAAISVLKDPDAAKRLRDLGYVLIGDQAEEFGVHVRSEIERLGKIVRRTGVTVD